MTSELFRNIISEVKKQNWKDSFEIFFEPVIFIYKMIGISFSKMKKFFY